MPQILPTCFRNPYRAVGKRALDLFLASTALLMLAPVICVAWIVVYCALGRPIFYTQKRPGKNGAPFKLYKFRSMTNAKDDNGKLLADEDRLTTIGRFLRSTSIDELPELWNVLKGEMSLVGPRPLLLEYLDRYTPEQARRHEIRPGMTGWAQVNGRNEIRFAQRFKLDVWYVDHYSLWLDIKILARTAWHTFLRKGIDQPGAMEVFRGTKADL